MFPEIHILILSNDTTVKGRNLVDNIILDEDYKHTRISIYSKFSSNYFLLKYNKITSLFRCYSELPVCDILVTAGWHEKIPNETISLARVSAINLHSSILPDYKGANIYNHIWANVEKYCGASAHYLTNKFDQGNILSFEKSAVPFCSTPKQILQIISNLTPSVCKNAIYLALDNKNGSNQNGGRYFFSISKAKLIKYRINNTLRRILNINIKHTPHRFI